MKRIIVILVFALLCSLVISAFGVSAETGEEVFEYYEYNFDTQTEQRKALTVSSIKPYSARERVEYDDEGNVISRWMPDEPGSTTFAKAGNSLGVQTLASTRNESAYTTVPNTEVSPYKYIGYISFYVGDDPVGGAEVWLRGSAFLEGHNTMVTAGHCCYTTDYGWTEQLYYYAAQNGSSYIQKVERKSITIPSAWKNNGDNNYDWGIVTLKTPIGETTGWFGKRTQTTSYVGTSVTMTGYPNTFTNSTKMHSSTGTVTSCTDYKLYSSYNTYRGASGSPIYYRHSNGSYVAIGVNTGHNDTYGALGVRFTQYFYDLLQEKYDEYINSTT